MHMLTLITIFSKFIFSTEVTIILHVQKNQMWKAIVLNTKKKLSLGLKASMEMTIFLITF